jgi:hypothetical protein
MSAVANQIPMAKITKAEASKVQNRADKSENPQLKELAQNLQSAADRKPRGSK